MYVPYKYMDAKFTTLHIRTGTNNSHLLSFTVAMAALPGDNIPHLFPATVWKIVVSVQ